MIRLYKKIQKYVKLCTFCDKITHKSRKKQRLLKKNTKNIYVKTVDICAKSCIVKPQEINETVFVKIAYSGGHLPKTNVEG